MADFDALADAAFHQLYDHSLGWYLAEDVFGDDADSIAEERARAAGIAPFEDDTYYLPTGITRAAIIAAGAELLLEEQVAMARADGSSWRDIAVCLGVHASAAHRRWGPRVAARVEQEQERRREWAAKRTG